MPIYQKDVGDLDKSSDELARLILGNRYKMAEAEHQANVDVNKARNMIPVNVDEARAMLPVKGEEQMQTANNNEAIIRRMQAGQPKGTSINVGANSMGINPPDQFMKNMALQEKMDARDDRDLVKLGERIDKAGLPNSMSAISNLESGTSDASGAGGILTNPNYEVKSAGPVANFLPQWAKNLGEKLTLMPEGSSQEAALIQRLLNADIKSLSGTAVTAYEMGRQNVEKGMSGMGDPELVKLGIKQMSDAANSTSNNIISSTRPAVVSKYKQQGGKMSLEEYLGKAPASDGMDAKRKRLEELKAKYGRK